MTKRRRAKKPKVALTAAERIAAAAPPGVPLSIPTEQRLARGVFVVEPIIGVAHSGDRPGAEPPRKVILGYALRDKSSSARMRLSRFKGLAPDQIEAGARLEAAWGLSGLEPRLVANLLGARGGSGNDVSTVVIDAKNEVHSAQMALRAAGEETLAVVEAIVLYGSTSSEAGSVRYADAARHNAHVAALLGAGLNLLAEHYRKPSEERVRRGADAQWA